MQNLKPILLSLLLTLSLGKAFGQDFTQKKEPTMGLAFGIMAHSFGFGFDVQASFLRPRTSYYLDVAMGSLKNPKELKIQSAYSDRGGKDYVFDKKNYAYTLAHTVGITRAIIPKSPYNKVSWGISAGAGPVLTLLKPYYLEVALPLTGNLAYVDVDKYTAANYNFTNIVGEADYFLGMNEIKVVPGFRLDAGTWVDFSASKEYIRTIKIGLFMDQYAKAPDIMDIVQDKRMYLGGSITILVGNTW